MDRVRLTPQRIDKFTCPDDKKQAFLWDSESPRLAVRVTKGAKSYIFESKLNRRTIRCTIGACSAWKIDDARKEANRLQTLIDRDIDPRELDREKKEKKAAQAAVQKKKKHYTLSALCDCYTDHLDDMGKTKSAAATRSAFKCHLKQAHPELAETAAADITPHHIAAIIRKVKEAGKVRMAGILRSYIMAAYNAAMKAPFDTSLPSSFIPFNVTSNPVDPISPIKVVAGNRTLSDEEIKIYFSSLGSDIIDQCLKLAFLSGGQRIAQLLRVTTKDYDKKNKTLRLWDTKGKRTEPREHLVPLAPKAAKIVENLLKRAEDKKSENLFASRGNVVHWSTPGKRVAELSTDMGSESFNLRDIRRTCETKLAEIGISRDIRAQLLSHGITGVQAKHYDRHDYIREKRTALIKWEGFIDKLITGKSKKIIELSAV